jgi:CHAT domain-containing protein
MRGDDYEVIEYLIEGSSIIVWHVTPDTIWVKNVFLPPEVLEEKVRRFRASISDKEQNFEATMARQLFLYLIEPVKADLKQAHLVIIPHGVLNRIPFQALQDPQDGAFAGERWQISYAPNATILVKGKKSVPLKGQTLLAVADPEITEALQEVAAIAALFPGKKQASHRAGQ